MERTVGVGGVGVLLWGRLGTPNPDTRFYTYNSLSLIFYSLYFTCFGPTHSPLYTPTAYVPILFSLHALHSISYPVHHHPFPLTPTAYIQLHVPLPTLHFLPYPLHHLPFPTLPAAAAMLRSAPRVLERHGFEQEHAPSGARAERSTPRKLRRSSAEAQLIHSYAARCRNYYVIKYFSSPIQCFFTLVT